MTHVVAFDPALESIAVVDARGHLEQLAELPESRDAGLTWIDGGTLQSLLIDTLTGRPAMCVLQRPSGLPWKVESAFGLGARFGSVVSVLQAGHLSVQLVSHSWKRVSGLSADPAAAVSRARLMFPETDFGIAHREARATALLLAHFGLGRGIAA
jgi:hypothetical protein